MSRVVHFEIPTTDPAASRKFYETVFGWTFTKWEGPMEYWLITTGPDSAPGINGGLGGAANGVNGTVNTVDVENIDEALKLALANGGQVIMPKDEIPGQGWVAYIKEPGGAVVGLFQTHPDARM
jgi:predicted enzyme related to lactoylglutathione lyase